MKRTPLKRGTSQLKRTPLARVSDKRKKVNAERSRLMRDRFGNPATWECWASSNEMLIVASGPCFGDIHGHEILSRARSGQSDANLLDMDGIRLLCNFHNEWCESNPIAAHRLGLVIHSWEVG